MSSSNPIRLPEQKFGVTLMLPDCAFTAELQRASISQVIEEIDSQLTEDGAPDDNEARVDMVMNNAQAVSNMVANQLIEQNEGVTDIAYSFIYALTKAVGFEQVIALRGLTGTFIENVLSLNPCLGDLEYEQETATLHRAMETSEDMWAAANPALTVH